MLKSLVRINMVVLASALHKHACSEQWPQRAPNTLRLPAMSSSAKKPARNTEKTEKAIPSLFLLESLRRVSRCAVLPHCRARQEESGHAKPLRCGALFRRPRCFSPWEPEDCFPSTAAGADCSWGTTVAYQQKWILQIDVSSYISAKSVIDL